MRYISLMIGSILALSSCNEVKFSGDAGEGTGTVTAGFRDSVITIFENMGTGSVGIDFSHSLPQSATLVLTVAEEENMQENKDYFIPVKELSVPAGEKSAEVNFSVVDDNVANDARSFTLKMVSLNGGVLDAAASRVKVKVLDDESDVAVGFETTAMTVNERESGSSEASYLCRIPVKLFGTLRKPLQFEVALHAMDVDNAAVENVNFRLPESVFVVEDADAEIYVPVEIIDDEEVNADRVFALDITGVSGGEVYTFQRRCMVTIKNDDMGIYFETTGMKAEERAGLVKIPVKLTDVAQEPVAFTIACGGSAVEDMDYSMTKTWTIEAGKDQVEIEVELKDLAGVASDRVLELQFAEVAQGIQVFEIGKSCSLNILDCSAPVNFAYPSKFILNDSTTLSLPVALSEPLEHDVTFRVKVTAREGISEDQAVIENSEVTIPAGSVEAAVRLSLKKLAFKAKASFRVEMSDVFGATMEENICTVSKYFKFATTDLAIADFTSEEKTGEGAGNGCAVNAIDGATDKFWHSIWNGGDPVLPEGIVVQLPDNMVVMRVDIIRRVHASNKDLREMKLYLSETTTKFLREDDGSAWGEPIGVLDWPNEASAQVESNTRRLELPVGLAGKYLKLSCTQSWRNSNVQIAEVAVYGYTE